MRNPFQKSPSRGSGRRGNRSRERTTPTRPATGTVAAQGKPFLRRLYRNPVGVSPTVQRLSLLLLAAGLIHAFVLGDNGAIRIAMLRHERAELARQIEELRLSAERLESEIARLQDDAFYIEKAGRERYGFVRKGDKVYRIVTDADD